MIPFKPGYVLKAADRLAPGWRKRQAKRKSLWNLLCVILGFVLKVLFWFGLFQAMWWLHVRFYPEHSTLRGAFWQDGISFGAFVPSFLMAMPLMFPAMVLGLISANCLVWCIRSARRVMDAEAAGDKEMTFAGANAKLAKWGGIISVGCFVVSLIGAAALKNLK